MNEPLGVPAWVSEIDTNPALRRIEACFTGTRAMDVRDFDAAVRDAYETIFARLDENDLHAVRFWAFLPGIHDPMNGGISRYMVFNAARYAAFTKRFEGGAAFCRSIPTASAVGVEGDRFSLHGLGTTEAGVPVENPRQVPAYRYSAVYGPKPPCFARATSLAVSFPSPTLLVAGTSSITGERSRHEGDLSRQFLETISNLAHLVANANGQVLAEGQPAARLDGLLRAFRHIRVYYVQAVHEALLRELVASRFPATVTAEYACVSLCRPELLVEIEGVAVLSTDS